MSTASTATYDIGQFDVTLNQYTAFLNAVAQLDGVTLYNVNMGSNPTVPASCAVEPTGTTSIRLSVMWPAPQDLHHVV